MALGTVTVPGVNGTFFQLSYDNPGNLVIAQAISKALLGFQAAGLLNPQAYAGTATPPAEPGKVNELVVQPGQPFVNNPNGYIYTADDTQGGSFSAVNVVNFIGGDGSLFIQNVAVPNYVEQITVGNGNDFLNLANNSTYNVGVGNGNDTVLAAGSGLLNLGSGTDSVTVYTGSDTIFGGTGGVDTVTKLGGSISFIGGGGSASITSATGGDTITGTANNDIVYAGGAKGSNLVAGAGSETLWAGNSLGGDVLHGSEVGGDDLLVSGQGYSALIAGNGNDTLVSGATGNASFNFIDHAAGGHDDLVNVTQNSVIALAGYDTLYGGHAGSDTAGRIVAQQLQTAVISSGGGPVSVTLADNTVITFENLTHGLPQIESN